MSPTQWPLNLGDIKRYGVIEHDDDDPLHLDILASATDYVERYLRAALISTPYEAYYSGFADCIELPVRPAISIEEIKYYDIDGLEQILDPSIYEADLAGPIPSVILAQSQAWPSVDKTINPVTVVFTAGYGTKDDVPDGIKLAIAMLVRQFEENREGIAFSQANEIPHSVSALLTRYRRAQEF